METIIVNSSKFPRIGNVIVNRIMPVPVWSTVIVYNLVLISASLLWVYFADFAVEIWQDFACACSLPCCSLRSEVSVHFTHKEDV